MAKRIYQLALACALIFKAHSMAVPSVNQQASSLHASVESFILMPFQTVESVLPLTSFVYHTYDPSAGSSDEKSVPSINVDNVYSIPTLGPIVSEINTISVVTADNITQEHANDLLSVSANYSITVSQGHNANNITGPIHAAQIRTPPINQSPSRANNSEINSPVINNPPINRPVFNKALASNNNPGINEAIVANETVPQPTRGVSHIKIPIPTAGYTSTLVTDGSKPNIVVTVKELPDEDIRLPACYRGNRKVPFSQYWIPKENEWDETNNGKRVYLGGNVKKRLMDNNNVPLGMVPVDMYEKCHMEGTCLLENGDLINIDNTTDSFIKVGRQGREHNVFGLGSGPQNLVPFVSIAANDLPYGQTLYIYQLDGLDLGGNQRHNGCVRVDDDSWSFDSCQIDFFVLSYVDYLWLDLDDKVNAKQKNCQIKNYITPHHLSYVKATNNETIIPSLLDAKYVV